MNYETEAAITRALGKMIAAGHLTRGFKPVYWCVDCRSALAEAEVEYRERESPAVDARFPVADEDDFFRRAPGTGDQGEGPLSVVIWTTTPWTLPANQAVAFHPEFDYIVAQCQTPRGPERLALAEQLAASALARYGVSDYRGLGPGQRGGPGRRGVAAPFLRPPGAGSPGAACDPGGRHRRRAHRPGSWRG